MKSICLLVGLLALSIPAHAVKTIMEGIEASNNAIYVATTSPNIYVQTAGTMTVVGNAFSVGVSTFVVKGGNVGIGTATPCSTCTLHAPNGVSLGHSVILNYQVAVTSTGVCSAATCTMTSNTGGISSITRVTKGEYNVNFAAGTFSSSPVCIATTGYCSAVNGTCAYDTLPTTSAALIACATTSAGALQDDCFGVICISP